MKEGMPERAEGAGSEKERMEERAPDFAALAAKYDAAMDVALDTDEKNIEAAKMRLEKRMREGTPEHKEHVAQMAARPTEGQKRALAFVENLKRLEEEAARKKAEAVTQPAEAAGGEPAETEEAYAEPEWMQKLAERGKRPHVFTEPDLPGEPLAEDAPLHNEVLLRQAYGGKELPPLAVGEPSAVVEDAPVPAASTALPRRPGLWGRRVRASRPVRGKREAKRRGWLQGAAAALWLLGVQPKEEARPLAAPDAPPTAARSAEEAGVAASPEAPAAFRREG